MTTTADGSYPLDLRGKVFTGPARRNLAQVAVSVEGETLKITP